MTLEEFYKQNGADYRQVLARMMGMESMVRKFVKKFTQDPTYKILEKAMEAEDCEEVFRAAHTLKGIAGNLGLQILYETSSELTEFARAGQWERIPEAFQIVKQEYTRCVEQIERIN